MVKDQESMMPMMLMMRRCDDAGDTGDAGDGVVIMLILKGKIIQSTDDIRRFAMGG
jgi:hypothetical protein